MLREWIRKIVREELEAARQERAEAAKKRVDDMASALRDMPVAAETVRDSLETRVVALRHQDMTWRAIGEALGISKSNAHRIYTKAVNHVVES